MNQLERSNRGSGKNTGHSGWEGKLNLDFIFIEFVNMSPLVSLMELEKLLNGADLINANEYD